MIAFLAIALLCGLVGVICAVRGRSARRTPPPLAPPEPDVYPESLTAVLGRDEEAYLAWLADHHWPDDEYLALEEDWAADAAPEGPVAPAPPASSLSPADCPRCRQPADDAWPCHTCGRTLHASCGLGMHRRRLDRPYRTPDMRDESVTAEWVCTGCRTVIGLDVEHDGGEAGGEMCR